MRFTLAALALLFSLRDGLATEVSLNQTFGRSSLSFLLEEEEEDAQFSFWSADLGFEQGDDKAMTILKAGRREKNFKARSSDTLTNRASLDARGKRDLLGRNITWGGGFHWRSKSFGDLSRQNYNEFSGELFGRNYSGWDAKFRADHFEFSDLKNENKLGLGLKKSIPWDDFIFNADGALERHFAQSRLKFKPEAGSSVIWKPHKTHWSHARVAIESGQRDTKSSEEREDNLDYSFWKIEANSTHPLKGAHELAWRFWTKDKDDKGGLFSHHGFSGSAQWRWDMEGPFGLSRVSPEIEIKRMKFHEIPNLTYHKESLGVSAQSRAADWKFKESARVDFYDYIGLENRRRILVLGADAKKSLAEDAEFSIGADLRHSLISFNARLVLTF